MNRENFPQFDSFVCEGDTIGWSCEGFDFVARIVHDHDTKPSDSECYTPEDITRWENDEWFYCGVVLSVSRNGVSLSDHAASLWGMDCNYGNDNKYLAEVAQELEAEALETARGRVAHMLEMLKD